MTDEEWLSVKETAWRLGEHEEAIRRKCREGRLPAVRAPGSPRAPWMVNAAALEEQLRRGLETPPSSGYGPAGREAAMMAAAHTSAATTSQVDDERERLLRRELLESVEDIVSDTDLSDEFKDLDEQERIEAEARRLAERVRRAERVRERAEEILEQDAE